MLLQLAAEQIRAEDQVTIVCYEDPESSPPLASALRELGIDPARVVSAGPPRSWLGRTGLKRAQRLARLLGEIDIMHLHGMWEGLLAAAALLAQQRAVPYVVCPAGMCDRVGLARGRLKKQLALMLWQRRVMRGASAIHAAALPEASDIRALGFRRPIAIIPNGLDLRPYSPPPTTPIEQWWPAPRDKKRLLFVGRVHPIKGLANLISAWAQLRAHFPQWQLLIAGPDPHGHRAELERQLQRLGLSDSATFTGPVYGEQKHALLAASDLFVLPSHTESFGIAAVEAMASGLPVVTTTGTPWRRVVDLDCGWWVEVGVAPLRRGLEQALGLSDEQRRAMGKRGRQLAQRFGLPNQARQVEALYGWICQGAPQPDFVYKDVQPLAEPT